MAYEVRIKTWVEVVNTATGKAVTEPIGTRWDEAAKTISAAGNELYRVTATVADNYTRITLWENGDGGLDDFDALVFISDKAVLLELVEDRAGTPLYSAFSIAANIPFVLSTDDIMNVVAVNESVSTTDTIDGIYCQNNVADAAGDASVTLLLVS